MSTILQLKKFLKDSDFSKIVLTGFPGGSVVKNPPASEGDTGLIPAPGRSYMPQSS